MYDGVSNRHPAKNGKYHQEAISSPPPNAPTSHTCGNLPRQLITRSSPSSQIQDGRQIQNGHHFVKNIRHILSCFFWMWYLPNCSHLLPTEKWSTSLSGNIGWSLNHTVDGLIKCGTHRFLKVTTALTLPLLLNVLGSNQKQYLHVHLYVRFDATCGTQRLWKSL